MPEPEPYFMVRIWIEGELLVKERLTPRNLSTFGPQHVELVEAAEALGKPWMLEFEDPDLPEDERYLRWGTDPNGMVEPKYFPPGGIGEAIVNEFARRYLQ